MKAHIVGGGFGGLAAAACLILNAGVPGSDIVIYEASEKPGGGFFLGGDPTNGYNLPGSVFDDKFFCAFSLLAQIPSLSDPSESVKDQFFAFNQANPFNDRGHIVDGSGAVVGSYGGVRPHAGRPLILSQASDHARGGARRQTDRRVLFQVVLLDRVLSALLDDHGPAAAAQRDGV